MVNNSIWLLMGSKESRNTMSLIVWVTGCMWYLNKGEWGEGYSERN